LSLYSSNEIPYKWSEVLEAVEADSEIFAACLRKAKRYKLPSGAPKSHKLWIACNLALGYINRSDCYLCGKVMKREEFLSGDVHLEHFNPRKVGGQHTPSNITIACKTCNLLKRDLRDVDFDLILSNPEAFRATHLSMSLRRYQQLVEFAEVIAPRFKGLNWIMERFGATSQNRRQVWEKLRSDYRTKWNIK
jgi:hypothetical protein